MVLDTWLRILIFLCGELRKWRIPIALFPAFDLSMFLIDTKIFIKFQKVTI